MPKGSMKRGAPMGRGARIDDESTEVTYVQRVRIDSGGYDPCGIYWGISNPLYCGYNPNTSTEVYARGRTRIEAIEQMQATFPQLVFKVANFTSQDS
jgi:hypothetical protein